MPKTTKTKVHRNESGQYQTTIPKALGDALDLEGKRVEWKIAAGNKLEIKITHD